jgi:phospholipase C
MSTLDRRRFLQAAAAGTALGAFPASIRRALAIPANNVTGTISDVQHVVILMQENRSFDHYFGTMAGVRGYGDRITIPQPGGASVWQQSDGSRTVMPYYLDHTQGNALTAGGAHSYGDAHQAWDNGRMTHWPQYKADVSMGYLQQADLQYQFALANAFTICDAYHCSLMGGTNSNRIHLWSGTNHGTSASSNGATVAVVNNDGWDGTSTTPLADSLTWTTYPERLQAAGVSWKVYQNLPDNYTDNSLSGFLNFRNAYQAVNGQLDSYSNGLSVPYTPLLDSISPLYKGIGNTMPEDDGIFLTALQADVSAGQLPQVSWIVAPELYCEHPGASAPGQGAWYIQQVLDILTSNAAVWGSTVLIIDFDENDCFFDHLPPPAPPSPRGDGTYAGASTVDASLDYFNVPSAPGGGGETPDGSPYGPGPRVPMLVISPWSRGGWVNSQAFDHTSVLRFLEQRFGVVESNISPWRRAVFGDLTSAFNFATPNDGALPSLPLQDQVTAGLLYLQQSTAGAVPVPAAGTQQAPPQASGTRPSRALPYELHVASQVDGVNGLVQLAFSNTGAAAAVFHVYDRLNLGQMPRRYTVEAGKQLIDSWSVGNGEGTGYDLWVLGPNGFHRAFQGNAGNAGDGAQEIQVCYDVANGNVYVALLNNGPQSATFTVTPNAYFSTAPQSFVVAPGGQVQAHWDLSGSGSWYDFSVTTDGSSPITRRFAGRVETGFDGISDPAMGNS